MSESKTATHDWMKSVDGKCRCSECIQNEYDRILADQLKRSVFYQSYPANNSRAS